MSKEEKEYIYFLILTSFSFSFFFPGNFERKTSKEEKKYFLTFTLNL